MSFSNITRFKFIMALFNYIMPICLGFYTTCLIARQQSQKKTSVTTSINLEETFSNRSDGQVLLKSASSALVFPHENLMKRKFRPERRKCSKHRSSKSMIGIVYRFNISSLFFFSICWFPHYLVT